MKLQFSYGVRCLLLITLLYSQVIHVILRPVPVQGANLSTELLETESRTHLEAMRAFHNKMFELEEFVMNTEKQALSDQAWQVDRFTQYQQELQVLGEQVQAEFQKNRLKLEELKNERKIPDEIIQRHDETASKFNKNFERWLNTVSNVTKGNEPITPKQWEQLYHATQQVAPRPPIQLTGVALPRPPEVSVATPSNSLSARSNVSAAQLKFPAPQSKDLAETVEIRFSPEIVDLAASLNHDPHKIYDYVHNEIQFEPYYGSIRGIEYLLLEKAGNDYDLASLTIALLRASNVPARYVQGTVEIPADKAASIAGFVKTQASTSLYFSAGMWKSWEIEGFNLKITWVIAYINGQWVHIVPWYKDNIVYPGIDFAKIGKLDSETIVSVATEGMIVNEDENWSRGINHKGIQGILSEAGGLVNDYILDNFEPKTPLQEVLGGVKTQKRTNIPFDLPFTLVTTPQDFSEISDSLRYKIRVEGGGIDVTFYTTQISGKRITVNYHAATDQDQAIIDSYGSIYDTQANLVDMEPTLWIDGEPKSVGNPLPLGTMHLLTYHFFDPRKGAGFAQTQVVAGGYYAVYFPVGRVTPELFQKQQNILSETRAKLVGGQTTARDNILGQILYLQTLTYWMQVHQYQDFSAVANNMRWVALPGYVSTVGAEVWPFYFNDGIPVIIEPGRTYIDVRYGGSPYAAAVDGDDQTRLDSWFDSLEPMGSFMENVVFETSKRVPSYSAAKLLQLANQQNKKIFTVSQDNLSSVLPMLSHDSFTLSAITAKVNSGDKVIISQQPVSYQGRNLSGWIERNQNGSGAWMIQRSYDGGASLEETILSLEFQVQSFLMDIAKNRHTLEFYTVFLDDGTPEIIPEYDPVLDKASRIAEKLGNYVTLADFVVKTGFTYEKVLNGKMTAGQGQKEIAKNIAVTVASAVAVEIVAGVFVASVPAVAVAGAAAIAGIAVGSLVEATLEKISQLGNPPKATLLLLNNQNSPNWSDNFDNTVYLRRMERTHWRAGEVALAHTSRQGIVMALGQRINAMVKTPDNKLYGLVWPDSRLFRYDPASQSITEFGGAVNGMMDMWELVYGPNGKLYGGTGSGFLSYLVSFDPTSQVWTNHGIPVSSGGELPTAETDILSLVSHSDGKIYGGTAPNGYLFSYNPNDNSFSVKGSPIPGETAITALVSGPNGKIYGTTSPHAHLFSFDPATNNFSDKGVVVSGESWIGALTVGSNGLIYGGTYPNAHLFTYNPSNNNVIDKGMPVPGETMINDLTVSTDGFIFGGTGQAGYLFAWSPVTNKTVYIEQLDSGELYLSNLAAGANGQIYAGTAGSAKLFTYTPNRYQPSGRVASTAISLPSGKTWYSLVYTTSLLANTSLTVDVLDIQGNLLLPKVTNSQSLASINPTDYPRIKLRASLTTTNQTLSPALLGWTVTFTTLLKSSGGVYLPIISKGK